MTEKIQSAVIELTGYSSHRTKRSGMPSRALREAFYANADFLAHNIDGKPVEIVCSAHDFAHGATVEIVERSGGFMNTACYFHFARQ